MTRHYLNNRGFYKLAQSIKDYINRKITGYAKLGTASTKDFTTYVSPTQTEQLPISSSVYSAMTNMLRGAYHPAGSKTIAELTSDLLVKANLGNVYKITEDGVTNALFIGGAGQTIKTGDNAIVLFASEDTYKFSLESGVVDLDAFQKKKLTQAIEGTNTVEDALVALSDGKVSTDLVPSNASAVNKLVAQNVTDAGWQYVNNAGGVTHYAAYKMTSSEGSRDGLLLVLSFSELLIVNIATPSNSLLIGNVYSQIAIGIDSVNNILYLKYTGYRAFKIVWNNGTLRLLSNLTVAPSDITFTNVAFRRFVPVEIASDNTTSTSRTFTLPSPTDGSRYKITFSGQQYNSPTMYYGEWIIGFAGTGITQVVIHNEGNISMNYTPSNHQVTFTTNNVSSYGTITCKKLH